MSVAPNSLKEPKRLPDRPKASLVDKLVGATALSSGMLLAFSMPSLMGSDSWGDLVKAITIAMAAVTVSFGVYKMAIEKGAPLAALNFVGAGITSIASIGIVGTGLFAATYSGLTIHRVDELQLQAYGTRLGEYVQARSQHIQSAVQIGPALKAIVSDLDSKAECEKMSSCISGKGNGRRGPVARVLEERAARTSGIIRQYDEGDSKRSAAISRLGDLLVTYRQILGSGDIPLAQRRIRLQRVSSDISQTLSTLGDALPLGLVRAYANELKVGAEISGNPEAAKQLGTILNNHAASLEVALTRAPSTVTDVPSFPAKPGVSDTFRYIGHFLPIAMIAGVIELVLPLALWLYTFWTLFWQNYKDAPPPPRATRREVSFEGLKDEPGKPRDDDTNPPAPRRGRPSKAVHS